MTSVALAAGDPKCPGGGSSFTSATATTYACNGAPGPSGAVGPTVYETLDTIHSVGPDANGGYFYGRFPKLPTYFTLASLTLHAGSYELFLNLDLLNVQSGDDEAQCKWDGDTFFSDVPGAGNILGFATNPFYLTASWHKASILTSQTAVQLQCASVNGNAGWQAYRFTAIPLGAINLQ